MALVILTNDNSSCRQFLASVRGGFMNKIKNVLLIDDDRISNWLYKTMLVRTELVEVVETIEKGKNAIDYLLLCCADPQDAETVCPDLILLDLDMPLINGFDVLNVLKQSERTAWLIPDRIVILTTTNKHSDMDRANAYGVHSFLVKPLTETKIKGVVERFLNRYKEAVAPELPENQDEVAINRETLSKAEIPDLADKALKNNQCER